MRLFCVIAATLLPENLKPFASGTIKRAGMTFSTPAKSKRRLTLSAASSAAAATERAPPTAAIISPEPLLNAKSAMNTVSHTTVNDIVDIVDQVLRDAGIVETTVTSGGWCLREGLLLICQAHNQSLLPLVQRHGPPSFYSIPSSTTTKHCRHEKDETTNSSTDNMKAPTSSFQSLCRIVAGQQLAGAAAQAIWRRLLDTTNSNLTPSAILELAGEDLEESLRKPAGLSKAKALAIVDLAKHFDRGDLTEDFLGNNRADDDDVREALLKVRGIGPWSCDMFAMFTLERPNILPLGDLGVRKGLTNHFRLRGSGKRGELCQKKDVDRIHKKVECFSPYHSLLSFYMWKAADTVDFYNNESSTPGDQRTTKKARKSK